MDVAGLRPMLCRWFLFLLPILQHVFVPHKPGIVDEPNDVLDHDLANEKREDWHYAQEGNGDKDD